MDKDQNDDRNGNSGGNNCKAISSHKANVTKSPAVEVVLRKFKRIPIYLVDYHNDVMAFIYRCIGGRYLPLTNNTLLHFDSHPDMVISRQLPASASYEKETMLSELSIENWIMPACYTGHFNRIIWMKNSWCQQIPIGKYNFKIGSKNGYINVDCPVDYFILEGNYCHRSELQETRDLELLVIDADTELHSNPKDFCCFANISNYVLDIDLDFFSTKNPFLEIYNATNCYQQLCEIFQFENPLTVTDASVTSDLRKIQLEALKSVFEYLEEKRILKGYVKSDSNVISTEIFEKISTLFETLQRYYTDEEIDWLLIYDAGSTTDTNGLPHHISTDDELSIYYKQFKQFLVKLPQPPTIVTMARSSEDEYCPSSHVDTIQDNVLRILQQVFGDKIYDKPIVHPAIDHINLIQL